MVKSIEDLKNLVKDGMIIRSKSGDEIKISRFPNNIIKIHNKSVSWSDFQDLLVNGEWQLLIYETDVDLFETRKKKRGGVRVPGPGKKLGRRKVADKKMSVSISMPGSVKNKLLDLSEHLDVNKNDLVCYLIKSFTKRVEKDELSLGESLDLRKIRKGE